MHEALASDSRTGVGVVWEGEREKEKNYHLK